MRAAVAAGHHATVEAGLEILEDGGSAADAAVAASLASCVAESVMTGLLGGGHGIYWDGRAARNLDCFVDVPSGTGAELVELPVPFGEELVHYAVGPGSCAVPGLPAGLDALWRAHGRLPWARLVEPALRLARSGVRMPPAHAACLAMVAPAYTLRDDGRRIYAPRGGLLQTGELLEQPGLVLALEMLATEGADACYRGTIAELLVAEDGCAVTAGDLERFEARWSEPFGIDYAGTRFLTRGGGLTGVAETLARLPRLRELTAADRVVALVAALEAARSGGGGHTTNVAVVDGEGCACVLTTSLGLGTGDFLPGLDLQLNSMLGEVDLLLGALVPGERMESMMAPSLAFDDDGLALAIGAAGGTRLRTALVGVAAAVLDEGLDAVTAVERPRAHPAGPVVHAEPGVDEEALRRLEAEGREVHRWADLHHYFGGVSLVARSGAAGDPRRSGHAAILGAVT
jgi:gamma-glutamyltranspeptidase / glutathione hydrolase